MQALIATSIALSVAGLATLANVETKVVAARQSIGKAQGKQLDVLASASDNYTIQNFAVLTLGSGQIQKADGTAGTVVSALSPTVQELVTLGFLQANFNATNYYGGGYKVSLGKLPFGCSYPNCSIGGTVSLTNAMMRPNGVVDYSTLGAAVQQIGADAGYSTAASAGTISGLSGGWSQTNPAGSVAGVLAERVGQGAQRYMAFLRRDGTLPMTGTLNMGGQGITGVKQVVTGSACVTKGDWADDSTSGAPVYCNGTPGTYVAISGGANWVANYASLPACNAAAKGQIDVAMAPTTGSGPRGYTCDGAAWQALAVNDAGNLTVAGLLTAGGMNLLKVAVEGASCNPAVDGNLAVTSTGLQLSCQSDGKWHVTTAQMPSGQRVCQGSSYLYGDTSNSAIRQPGDLYVQNQAGSGYRNTYGNDFYVASIGKWASQLNNTTYVTNNNTYTITTSACGVIGGISTVNWQWNGSGYTCWFQTCGSDGSWRQSSQTFTGSPC